MFARIYILYKRKTRTKQANTPEYVSNKRRYKEFQNTIKDKLR